MTEILVGGVGTVSPLTYLSVERYFARLLERGMFDAISVIASPYQSLFTYCSCNCTISPVPLFQGPLAGGDSACILYSHAGDLR